MEHLLKFYADAAKNGNIDTHVVYATGTCVRVAAQTDRNAAICAADGAISGQWTAAVPIYLAENWFLVQFVPTAIQCIVGADSPAAAEAIAKDSLREDRENKKVFAVIWNDLTVDVAADD